MEQIGFFTEADEMNTSRGKNEKTENSKKKKALGLTPMMQQYVSMKEENPDSLLFFRLGDFYELFFEDAVTASRELELTLTGRDCGLEERAPMCGVPHHAVDGYLRRLVEKGYKVAICEQLTDPAEGKGLVERGIVRIVTPGTVMEESMLDAESNRYILSLHEEEGYFGLAYADISTGLFALGEVENSAESILLDEVAKLQPAEIILSESLAEKRPELYEDLQRNSFANAYPVWAYKRETAEKNILGQMKAASLEGYGCADMHAGIAAAGGLLAYLNETQRHALQQINDLKVFHREKYMLLDAATRRNLELTQTIRGEKKKKGTLLGLLNRTETAMGARMLRTWIEEPLQRREDIEERLVCVEELKDDLIGRESLRDILTGVQDIERLAGRLGAGSFHARDGVALGKSLSNLKALPAQLAGFSSSGLQEIAGDFDPLTDVAELLERALDEDAPLSIKEGGVIKTGYNEQVDKLRGATEQSKDWLNELEARERQATNIKNLRVGFNRVFGYYIEVTKSYLEKVPFRYQRKQTLANAERYVTQELKELESQILGASEKAMALEYHLFVELRKLLADHIPRIQRCAALLAKLDVLQSLAAVASEYDYVRPAINEEGVLEVREGRHPVVERFEKSRFVPNDLYMDRERRLLIITGPNMAGKSTFMRQIALIVLMAHIGSFVPAAAASIPLTDRIFTRVGASDDLSEGRSTFMVEMTETANILNGATGDSLVLMDEIGRGTSTFDGLSIAWAVCEYISDPSVCGAKTLFATHYHELSELEGLLPGAVNVRVSVKEIGDRIVFLRKVLPGGSDKSFGIQVAKLAGVPDPVIGRAKEILLRLEETDVNHPKAKLGAEEQNSPLDAAAREESLELLRELDVDSLSPREALDALYMLKEKIKK